MRRVGTLVEDSYSKWAPVEVNKIDNKLNILLDFCFHKSDKLHNYYFCGSIFSYDSTFGDCNSALNFGNKIYQSSSFRFFWKR